MTGPRQVLLVAMHACIVSRSSLKRRGDARAAHGCRSQHGSHLDRCCLTPCLVCRPKRHSWDYNPCHIGRCRRRRWCYCSVCLTYTGVFMRLSVVVCEENKSVYICSRILRCSGASHGLWASWWLLKHDLLRPLWRGPHGRPRLCEYHVKLFKWGYKTVVL